jgi:hypothetical protein
LFLNKLIAAGHLSRPNQSGSRKFIALDVIRPVLL